MIQNIAKYNSSRAGSKGRNLIDKKKSKVSGLLHRARRPNKDKNGLFGHVLPTSKHKLNETPIGLLYEQEGYDDSYGGPGCFEQSDKSWTTF